MDTDQMLIFIVGLVGLSLTLNLLLLYRFVWTTPSRIRDITKKGFIAAFAVGVTVFVLEFVFMQFMVASDGFDFTLSSKAWFQKHWKPINALGYRDLEHDISELADKDVLFVVGDSFVAGHGVEDYRDRFSDVLAERLGPKWDVFNIAQNGWDTNEEFAAIQDIEIAPDAIILSYFVNDIEGAAKKVGIPRPASIRPQAHWLVRPVVKRSYLLNFCYWRLSRFGSSKELGKTYMEYLDRAYNEEEVWSVHKEELRQFVDYARQNDIRLVVVVFPNPADIDATRTHTDKVVQFFKDFEVPVVDLAPILADRSTSDLVVNGMDAHPSVSLHKEVAALLFPLLKHSPEAVSADE